MLTFQNIPTTCTCNILTNWDGPKWVDPATIPTKNAKISMLRAALEHVKSLESTGYKLDFDCLIAICTHDQWKHCHGFIEKIGFKEVYQGNKKQKEAREKNTGHLHLYAVHPVDFKKSCEEFLKEIKDLLDELDPPMVADPERAKFPDMILTNFYGHSLIKSKGITPNHRIRTSVTDLDKFKALLSMKFGTDFSDEDSKFIVGPLEENPFVELLNAQRRWKEDKVILLSDLKKRKA